MAAHLFSHIANVRSNLLLLSTFSSHPSTFQLSLFLLNSDLVHLRISAIGIAAMFGSAPKQASSPAVPADMATQQSAELSDSARKQFLTLTQQLMDMKHKIEDTMQNLEGDIELLNRPECRRAEAKGRDSAGATEVDRGLENGRKSVASHPVSQLIRFCPSTSLQY